MGSEQDRYALVAWKAQVLQKARKIAASFDREFQNFGIDVIRQLVTFSTLRDGPVKAVEHLKRHGIIVVFERHLPSTHLDGAAMLLNDGVPVIGLTLRFDRLDNFWFVLLHECGHVFLHRDLGLRDGFFDEEEIAPLESVEAEADEFAQSAFIPTEEWKRAFVRFSNSSAEVTKFALERHVAPAIVAGRIRRERKDYKLFSELVGTGTIRKLMIGAGHLES
jgi:HTH-type transcriptional regulator/antitoxin HigA